MLFAQLGIFYGLVLRARVSLGRWPEPYRPDPKDGFLIHSSVAVVGAALSLVTPVLAVVLLAAAKALGLPPRQLRVAALVFGACYLGALAVYVADPGRFGAWLMD